jgi:uncharacterized protein (DUF305 family)
MGIMRETRVGPFSADEMGMRQKMMSAVGSGASQTWVRKMIELHSGAIAISRIVLRDHPDAHVRATVTKYIVGHTRDISDMQRWLRQQGESGQ